MIYSERVFGKIETLKNAGKIDCFSSCGVEVSFICGTFVRVFLKVDSENKKILEVKFQSNGCGFAVAFSDILSEKIKGKLLTELYGLECFLKEVEAEIGQIPKDRNHCVLMAVDAFRSAFAELRKKRIQEFKGESALICSCFGVSEETIEKVIEESEAKTVDEVSQACRAGLGCGSCRHLIQEILDSKKFL
ncbi:MAG: iron-sulfur cluster assembly scaffold protein [Pyrinomonadaceae bacterium]|nr:iron-sulfur cluster assembly scaffold protein [Pyrinomonadaceae bacterium]MCX7640506.1 iron-sulfur cluster assembly scaffold protein [Pyrinomonadaceae bacterium]MDW8303913.1 iron-sulfur cluster assembly scaffold protein [Acidobacteriota bacterium]